MSKKGRSSVVLLGSVVFGLLILALVYRAFAGQLDKTALERGIAFLESTAIESPSDLQARYRSVQTFLLPIAPPAPDCGAGCEEGIVVFDPKDFEGWTDALEPEEWYGVTVYPVIVAEDPDTRETLFLSRSGKEIAGIAPEKDYEPYACFAAWWPELLLETADPAKQAWHMAVYDPARISATYYLLPIEDVPAMAEAMLVEAEERASQPVMRMMMGDGLPAPVSNLVFFAIEQVTNGMALGIGWPDDFTNNLEVFARDTLAATGWAVISTNLSTAGTNSIWWVDTAIDSNTAARFYRAGNADLDSDGDGIPDARERHIHGTAEDNADSDSDGLSDGEELTRRTNPLDSDSDEDGLEDGVEVNGYAAWNLQAGDTNWVEQGTNGVWLSQWPAGKVSDGWVDSAFSTSMPAALVLRTYTSSTIRVATDGYILLDPDLTYDADSQPINRSMLDAGYSNMLAVFWDDLKVAAATGIWMKVEGSGNAALTVVTWVGAKQVSPVAQSKGLDFQMAYSASNRAYTFRYRPLAGEAFPANEFYTAGIRGDLCPYAQLAFNGIGSISNGAWRFVPACTSPTNTDTDADGFADGEEATNGMNPLVADEAETDADSDGLMLAQEIATGTEPFDPDTDKDGFPDGADPRPLVAEDPDDSTDWDYLSNWEEYAYGTNPIKYDTDSDGLFDGLEVWQGSDPTDTEDTEPVPAEALAEVRVTLSATRNNPERAGGTAFRIGRHVHRLPPGAGTYTATYLLPRGRTYNLTVVPTNGVVEDRSVETIMEVDGFSSLGQTGEPIHLGASMIERADQALGCWDVVPVPTNCAVLTIPRLRVKLTDGDFLTEYNGNLNDEVALTALVEPAMDGEYEWSRGIESVPMTASGANATFTLTAETVVTVAFTPAGGSLAITSNVSLKIHDHIHVDNWGHMSLTLSPFIRVNDNDSDFNETTDREESPPPANDPDLAHAVFSVYYNGEGMLDCCWKQFNETKPPWKVTLICDSNSPNVRLWDGGTALSAVILTNVNFTESPFQFEFDVEGTNISEQANDVRFTGTVSFSNNATVSESWYTSVGMGTVDICLPELTNEVWIKLNDDDDDRNGINDVSDSGAVEDEDDLLEIPLGLAIQPPDLVSGYIGLFVTEGTKCVRFWADSERAVEFFPVWTPYPWPDSVFVEGIGTSTVPRNVELNWGYSNGNFTCTDTIRLTVVRVDLDVERIAEGDEEVWWPINKLFYNHDDDNANGICDREETNAVAGENDLLSFSLGVSPSTMNEGKYILECLYMDWPGWEDVRVYASPDKTARLTLPAEWNAGTSIPTTLWVEGYSSDNWGELRLRYVNDVVELQDFTRFESFDLNLSLEGMTDPEEDATGGFIGLNADDDNENGTIDWEDGAGWGIPDDDLVRLELFPYYPDFYKDGIFHLEALQGADHIRLWSGNATNGFKTSQYSATNIWDAAVTFPPHYVYIEGVKKSDALNDVVLRLSYTSETFRCEDLLRLTVLKVDIAMDGNRDESIEFDNPEDAAYLFWVNDDYDLKHQDEGIWQEDDDNPATHHDCQDNYIGNSQASGEHACKRDLEDFTRLHIKVDDNTANLSGITYFLKFENVTSGSPSVNVFEAVDESSAYLSDTNVAADQIEKENLTPDGVGTTEVQIDEQYIKAGNLVSPFIIEGRSAGEGDLAFIVKMNGNEICKKAVTLELHEMPWFYDVYSVGVSSGDRWEVQIPTTASHSQIASYSPATDEKFLLVHGWNMTDAEKAQWAETVFKRLWWQGYQGSVASFNWPTLAEYGGFWDVVTNPHHFDNSEFRAWLSSDALIGVFNTLNESANKLRVMAHSMGNVATGEAIRRYTGANLHTYLACQAALSAHYYDNTIAATNPCQHQGFPHDLFFPGTPDIIGHFSTGDTNSDPYMVANDARVSNMQNYYNALDWALDLWEINNVRKPDDWAPYLFDYSGSEDHYQEGTDRFTRGPINDPYEVLSVTNQQQRFMIWAYDAESRSKALGQTANGEFNDWNLHDDLDDGGMGYDGQHYAHSREFRSNIADEWNFWNRVFSTCQFQHP